MALEKLPHPSQPGDSDGSKPPSHKELPARRSEESGYNEVNENEPAQATATELDVPPNGGYGWVCVTSAFCINAHTWGMNSSYGVFLAYYIRSGIFPGATRLHFAFIGGLSVSAALLVSPIATIITRTFGTRTTLLTGVFFETISLIASSFAKEIWQLFLAQGVCFGIGMGFLFVGSVVVIPQWFTTRRSLANGIAASGSGLGGLVYSLSTNAMIQHIGLAWAFRILGILACVVNTICSLLMKDRNKQIGSSQLPFDHRLFRKSEFVLLQLFGFFSMLGYIVLLFSLPNFAESVGMTPKQGSIIGAVLNLGQALGRPPIGYFSDAVGRLNMAVTMTFLAGLFSLVIWPFATSFGVLIFFALIGGSVAGTFWAVVSPVTAEVIGLVDLPSALSITWLSLVLPTTFSEVIGLQIVAEQKGRYLGTQLFAGIMYITGAIMVWLVRAWKIGQLEEAAAENQISVDMLDPITLTPSREAAGHSQSQFPQKSSFLKRMIKWQKV